MGVRVTDKVTCDLASKPSLVREGVKRTWGV